MTTAEKLTLWLAQLRDTGRGVLVARLVIAAAGALAIAIPGTAAWDQLDLIPLVAIPLLAATVILPDSLAGVVLLLTVTLGWLIRAPAELSWQLVLTAIAVVVTHLATAFAAQLPSYVRVERRAVRRWVVPGAIALIIAPLVAIAAALVKGADVPGSLLVTVGALVLATITIWFAAGQRLGRD
ncbi:hypothetical protein GCM10009745_51840 [Kribbella yunnanensis]|uniref:Uncharacterized protein n=1 Tax=Kribbella yunnanensis TaxID=190194 RepID=A0ABN2I5G8_9ACTN